jgi:hypothetical protein
MISLLLVTGEAVQVEGTLEAVANQLENAARSSAGTMAWFEDPQGDEQVGVNPSHVVLIRRGRG